MVERYLSPTSVANWLTNEGLLPYLKSIDFFDKPASVNHHLNTDGGLFQHSYNVYRYLQYYTNLMQLHWQREESPLVIGILHDICKCDDYVKKDGKWAYNDEKIMNGHGDKSVIMIAGHYQLTEEEALCIRFHMGAFSTDDWTGYGKAIDKYPNVLYAHTADMAAAHSEAERQGVVFSDMSGMDFEYTK